MLSADGHLGNILHTSSSETCEDKGSMKHYTSLSTTE